MDIFSKLDKLMKIKNVIDDSYEFSIQVRNLNDEIQNSSKLSFDDKLNLIDKFNDCYKDTNYKKMNLICDIEDWQVKFGSKAHTNMSNVKVSIVLPIYNKVEYGLERGIQSCLNQTHKNLEIICVNDCSTDDSLKVIEHFAKIDTRIVSLDLKENKKCSGARIAGWEIATGEYIVNVDPDDWIDDTYIEEALGHALQLDIDIVNLMNLFKHVEKCVYYGYILDIPFLDYCWAGDIPLNVCGKIYRTDIVRKSLNELKSVKSVNMAEDMLLNTFLFSSAKSVGAIESTAKYHYERNQGSITLGQNFYKKIEEIFYVSKIIREKCNSFFIDRYMYWHSLDYIDVNMKDMNLHDKLALFSTLDKEVSLAILPFLYEDVYKLQGDNYNSMYKYKQYKLDKITYYIEKMFPESSIKRDCVKLVYKIAKRIYKRLK